MIPDDEGDEGGVHGHVIDRGEHIHPELGITIPGGEHRFHVTEQRSTHKHDDYPQFAEGGEHRHGPLNPFGEHTHQRVTEQPPVEEDERFEEPPPPEPGDEIEPTVFPRLSKWL